MRVEMKVDWDAAPRLHNRKTTVKRLEALRSRAERRLWYIALSRHIDELIGSGQADSLADIARMCCVSRARISQLLDSALT